MKITTLIPGYKTTYLFDVLHALRYQTVKPQRVIISDDSPNQAFVHILQDPSLRTALGDLKIETILGPRTGGWDNAKHLFKYWGGSTELFHLLLDDDYIYPDFYQRHIQAHEAGDFECSVSRRWTARDTGQPVEGLPLPPVVADHPHRVVSLDPAVLFFTTVGNSTNWLGEFSNAVFKAGMCEPISHASMGGISYRGLEDLGAFLTAGTVKPLCFINENLGYFRKHQNQNSALPNGRPMKMAFLAYIALALAARRIGKLSPAQVSARLAAACPMIVQYYTGQPDLAGFCQLMPTLATGDAAAEQAFLELWQAYVNQG